MGETVRRSDEVVDLIREQTRTNTQVLERLDKANEKLSSIDSGFKNVVEKYHEFSNKMDQVIMTFKNFKGYFVVFGGMGVGIGVAIAIALFKIAFP